VAGGGERYKVVVVRITAHGLVRPRRIDEQDRLRGQVREEAGCLLG